MLKSRPSAARAPMAGCATNRWHRTEVPQPEVLPVPGEDRSDCVHGCNGDCVESGSERCDFTCHGNGDD